ALTLALLLALTGQGLAQSRGMSAAVGQMTLCTGTGPVVVYVDDQGQPTKAPHYCPDFALALMAALLPDPASAAPPPEPSTLRRFAQDRAEIPAPRTPRKARAPPLVV
ncbi:hypothetical protein AB9K41_24760, partial [Cribrihabitans sp. XS_ASV171]